mmetsp:Transcript_1950/g.4587  ORF Transcript_1950/g.4587 Transcript_1950/m.4587 type:complete len:513 (+) Transcript_1950:316-1854(+)
MAVNNNGKNSNDNNRAKKTLIIDTIKKNCASSSHEILQRINHIINLSGDGSKLEATVLSGGYTNYAFKVFVDKYPDLCVFAKLCFEYALWDPTAAQYDLERTANEYEIMKTISSTTPECVVTPLACWDIEEDEDQQRMRLLVTEWSNEANEQFCNQFIDGAVDPRIAPKIANTLAILHNVEDFDLKFNEAVKPCMENLLGQMKGAAREASKVELPKDRTETYCASLGEDGILKIVNASIANYHKRDCLIHSDAHQLNVLVEARPSIENLETFGPNGTVILCDWEMAMVGPIGRDIGVSLGLPVSYMIYHALSGNLDANESIEAHINALLDTYCSRMVEAGKTPEDMAAILREIAGWCGWGQYTCNYVLSMLDFFPMGCEESKRYLRDALGVLGLKLMRLSYDTEYVPVSTGVEEIRMKFNSLWQEEVARAHDMFTSGARKIQARKNSILRASNRRFSDTEAVYSAAESMKMIFVSEDSVDTRNIENTKLSQYKYWPGIDIDTLILKGKPQTQ